MGKGCRDVSSSYLVKRVFLLSWCLLMQVGFGAQCDACVPFITLQKGLSAPSSVLLFEPA